MKNATNAIRALREAQPVRQPDDPLRNFLSEVILRDHARLLRLTLRKLHVGAKAYEGDYIRDNATGNLVTLRVPWWRLWVRVPEGEEVYRSAE